MLKPHIGLLKVVLFISLSMNVMLASLETAYSIPPHCDTSKFFTVKVDGRSVPVFDSKISKSITRFSFSGTSRIEVTAIEDIESHRIFPGAYGYRAQVKGRSLTFDISDEQSGPNYLAVKINDFDYLLIFADPPEKDIPQLGNEGIFDISQEPYLAKGDFSEIANQKIIHAVEDAHAWAVVNGKPGIVYVPPGVFKITEDLHLKSSVHLYLSPDAVLRASTKVEDFNVRKKHYLISIDNCENVRIYGRGIIDGSSSLRMESYKDPSRYTAIQSYDSENLKIEDILLLDNQEWNINIATSTQFLVERVKILSRTDWKWNDGFDASSSCYGTFRMGFAMTGDDNACAKAGSKWDPRIKGDIHDIVWENMVFWTNARGCKTGMQSYYQTYNITFKDIHFIFADNPMEIDHKDGNAPVYNISYQNIVAEEVGERGIWLNCKDGNIYNIEFKNINLAGFGSTDENLITVHDGYSVRDVRFDDLYIEGRKIQNKSDGKFVFEGDVSDVAFK